MRKIIFIAGTSFIILIFSVIFFVACSKKVVRKNCSRPPDETGNVIFTIANVEFNSDIEIYKYPINENIIECVEISPTPSEELFQIIKSYCINSNIEVDKKSFAIVLYYDSLVSGNYKIVDENIKGISLWRVKRNKIIHTLFVKNHKNIFIEEENVRIAVHAVCYNHIDFYFSNYVFTDTQDKSFILISGDYFLEVCKNYKKYRKTPFRYEVNPTK